MPACGTRSPKSIVIFEHDLTEKATNELAASEFLQIDTETDGLDYRKHKLRAVTITNKSNYVYIVKDPSPKSENLIALLESFTPKIFHHAFFDLCFLRAGLHIDVNGPIECTKILMKILHPTIPSGLGSSISAILGIKIDKQIDHTKWKNKKWSGKQRRYMANDTIYLAKLFYHLKEKLDWESRKIYAKAKNAMIDKVYLETSGYTDLLDYPQAPANESKENRKWWHEQITCG